MAFSYVSRDQTYVLTIRQAHGPLNCSIAQELHLISPLLIFLLVSLPRHAIAALLFRRRPTISLYIQKDFLSLCLGLPRRSVLWDLWLQSRTADQQLPSTSNTTFLLLPPSSWLTPSKCLCRTGVDLFLDHCEGDHGLGCPKSFTKLPIEKRGPTRGTSLWRSSPARTWGPKGLGESERPYGRGTALSWWQESGSLQEE